jgi:hypothetical protein
MRHPIPHNLMKHEIELAGEFNQVCLVGECDKKAKVKVSHSAYPTTRPYCADHFDTEEWRGTGCVLTLLEAKYDE